MSRGYRVAVVGATGVVGTTMRALLRERQFPAREIVAFATERSAGRELEDGLVVQALNDDADSRGSTSRCSPPAPAPRGNGRRASRRPAPR